MLNINTICFIIKYSRSPVTLLNFESFFTPRRYLVMVFLWIILLQLQLSVWTTRKISNQYRHIAQASANFLSMRCLLAKMEIQVYHRITISQPLEEWKEANRGNIHLVKDDNIKPIHWQLGRIEIFVQGPMAFLKWPPSEHIPDSSSVNFRI